MLRVGKVAELQLSPPRVKVEYDKDVDNQPIISCFLPYFEERASHKRTWDPPRVGEQCMLLSPSGDLRNAIVLLGVNTKENPPVSDKEEEHVVVYDDGSIISYDREKHQYVIDIKNEGADMLVKSAGTLNIQTEGNVNMVCKGNMNADVTGDYTVNAGGDYNVTASKVHFNEEG